MYGTWKSGAAASVAHEEVGKAPLRQLGSAGFLGDPELLNDHPPSRS
jgi:hypothetical protein